MPTFDSDLEYKDYVATNLKTGMLVTSNKKLFAKKHGIRKRDQLEVLPTLIFMVYM